MPMSAELKAKLAENRRKKAAAAVRLECLDPAKLLIACDWLQERGLGYPGTYRLGYLKYFEFEQQLEALMSRLPYRPMRIATIRRCRRPRVCSPAAGHENEEDRCAQSGRLAGGGRGR